MFKKSAFYFSFLILIFLAIFAPFLTQHDPSLSNLNALHKAPSMQYFFGTDLLGRDLFARNLYALRTSLFIGFCSSFLAILFGVIYVFLARLFFYHLFMRFLDMFLALPALLLMMFFQSFVGGGMLSMIFIIALTHWPFIAKVLENQIKSFENLEFYQAAIVLGRSKNKILFKDVMPACFSLLFVLFVINIVHAISTEATLSFFGLGLAFEIPSLGNILNDGAKAIFVGAWWIVAFALLFLLWIILPLLSLSNYLQKRWGIAL